MIRVPKGVLRGVIGVRFGCVFRVIFVYWRYGVLGTGAKSHVTADTVAILQALSVLVYNNETVFGVDQLTPQ
jgi:hypothetical protein